MTLGWLVQDNSVCLKLLRGAISQASASGLPSPPQVDEGLSERRLDMTPRMCLCRDDATVWRFRCHAANFIEPLTVMHQCLPSHPGWRYELNTMGVNGLREF